MTPRYWYFISNRATHQCIDLVADSPEAACREVGWSRTNCVVITVGEMHGVNGGPSSEGTFQPPAAPPDGRRRSSR